jgi:membrane-bound lytic murein transglycosylase MltF
MLARSLTLAVAIIAFSCGPGKENTATTNSDSTAVQALDTAKFTFNSENEFLGLGVPHFGDLDSMIARRRIRALVPYTQMYYYIDGKERRGIAFDALNLFEKQINDQLGYYPPKVRVLFIPVNRSQVIPLLRDGFGDIGYAGITITEDRKKIADFSLPTITGLKEIVVGGRTSPKLHTLADLSGKEIYLREGSSYESAVMKLNDSLARFSVPPVIIKTVDPYLETEDMLGLVNSGVIPYTATVEEAARLWSTVMDSLVLFDKMPLATNVSYGMLFRKDSPKLKRAADKFVQKNARGTVVGNMIYNQYVKNVKLVPAMHNKRTVAQVKTLRKTFERYGAAYRLDWLLLVAQGYQESGLNQQARSGAGAQGIMQVLPTTAAGQPIFIKDISTVDNNVHAGVKYMRWLVDQYFSDAEMDTLNQQLFALAAYNCGPGRTAQLRRMAKAKGLNPNKWFDNVEIIAAQEIGRETVQYVSNIYKFYASYRALDYYLLQRGKKVGDKRKSLSVADKK